MKILDLNEVAEYLAKAIIIQTIDAGFALTHYGMTSVGNEFFLMNDANGNSSLFEF